MLQRVVHTSFRTPRFEELKDFHFLAEYDRPISVIIRGAVNLALQGRYKDVIQPVGGGLRLTVGGSAFLVALRRFRAQIRGGVSRSVAR